MPLNPDMFTNLYKPDVLSCLADLSNDEVFTPPDLVNKVLDMLPQELFRDPNTTFLDPAVKSGVFLREIAKRLIAGLADKIPNLQERCDWIFQHQLYGIAMTELTSLLSRRSLYCSKYPNSPFSISKFDNIEGNIKYHKIKHTWDKENENGKCIFCGIGYSNVLNDVKREGMENHAYEFIHTLHPEEIFNMKFDVICANPPYQLEINSYTKQAKPIYNLFVEQAKKLNPRYITMIIPSRWYSGGIGLNSFRDQMMKDRHIVKIVDFANAKDCFPQNSIGGGVCYFLRDSHYNGDCEFINVAGDKSNSMKRDLDEFEMIVRYNEAIPILHKIANQHENKLTDIISPLMPFGLPSNYRGDKEPSENKNIALYSSKDVSYISKEEVKQSTYLNKHKIFISKLSAEHAGEPDKDGKFRVITTSIKIVPPQTACTHSYFVIGASDNKTYVNNVLTYITTKFVRFLVLLTVSSINLSKSSFSFVPIQDFSKPWTDEELYKKYNLTDEEIAFIESMIKPMDLDTGGDE